MAIVINGSTGISATESSSVLGDGAVEAADLASGAAVSNIGYTPANIQAQNIHFRNRIINGDMRIDQRNAGASVTASNSYPVDRFLVQNVTDGAFSAQQDSSAPAGFVNSIKWTTTTADTSLTTTQQASIQQRIEGTNVADLAWGTANAKTVTLSFWVRSSLTGTFGGSLRNSVIDRSYPFTYTISAADTWEYKTVTIPGETSGTWLTNTGVGMYVTWGLGTGPDRSGTAGAWNSNNNNSATGAVSVIGTLNATWYITGVQLEVGSVATEFERRPYGTELALCQRYCQLIGNGAGYSSSTTAIQFSVQYITPMRAAPTASGTSSSALVWTDGAANYTASSTTIAAVYPGTTGAIVNPTNFSGMTQYRPGAVNQQSSSGGSATILFTAEL